jgi:O-antigen/teichoic acid export membrane protein
MSQKIITNSILKTGGFIFTVVVTFFLTPFLISRLGNTLYGIWSLLIGLTGYLGLLDLGLRTAIIKYISEYLAANDFEKIKQTGSTAITFFLAAGVLSWIVLIVGSFFIRDIFNISTDEPINFTIIMFIIGADVFFTFLFMIYQGSIAGYQRYDISIRNGLIAFTLKTILIILILFNGYGLIALSLAALSSNLCGYLLNYYSFKTITLEVHYSIGIIDKKIAKKLWQYSWKSFVTNISDRLIYYSDSIIIGIFLNAEAITFYTIGSTIIVYIRQLILSAAEVFIPAISAADSKKETDYINQMTIKCSKLIFFILIPICNSLLVNGSDFIGLWIGKGYESSYLVLVILLVSQFLVLSQYGLTLVLYGTGQHGILAKTNILAAVSNILLSVILVNNFGIIGVALGSAIPIAFLRFAVVQPKVFKVLKLTYWRYFKEVIGPVSIVFCLHYISLWALQKYAPITNWVDFCFAIGLCSIIFVLLFYLLVFSKLEKKQINKYILSFINKKRIQKK